MCRRDARGVIPAPVATRHLGKREVRESRNVSLVPSDVLLTAGASRGPRLACSFGEVPGAHSGSCVDSRTVGDVEQRIRRIRTARGSSLEVRQTARAGGV